MADAERDISKVKYIHILDGSFKSLRARKLKMYENLPKALNINSYDLTRDIHLEYLRAGATVIRTNTFSAGYPRMYHLANMYLANFNSMISESVQAAREAIEKYVKEANVDKEDYWILGSCGSATRCGYLSVENLKAEDCKSFHENRIRAFIANKVDGLAFECIETEIEALAILELIKVTPDAHAYMTFRTDNVGRLRDGASIRNISEKCYFESFRKIFAFGVSCVTPTYMRNILLQYNIEGSKFPLVACPGNHGTSRYISTWEPMNEAALQWAVMNIRFIGGCCNIFPEHIKRISSQRKICYL